MPHQDENHPITAGLVALVSVTVAVGLVLGVVTFRRLSPSFPDEL